MRLRDLLLEGAKVSQQAISQALADPRLQFGFEAEFQVIGADRVSASITAKSASQNPQGEYVKDLSQLSYSDLVRFFGPVLSQSKKLSSTEAIDNRLRVAARVHLKNQDALLQPHEAFTLLRDGLGPEQLLALTKCFPIAGYEVEDDDNLRILELVKHEPGKVAQAISGLQYRLFVKDASGDRLAFTPQTRYGVSHVNEPGTVTDFLQEIARRLRPIVGTDVLVTAAPLDNRKASQGYQRWLLTTDVSINADHESVVGAELISPAMPFDTGMNTTRRVLSRLDDFQYDTGGVHIATDPSTAFQVSLSLRGVDPRQIDWIKLVVLFGEEYALSLFDRHAVMKYSEPVVPRLRRGFDDIRQQGNPLPLRDPAALRQAIELMFKATKYYAINVEKLLTQGIVELRVMGGRNYQHAIDRMFPLIYRFAVMLIAAADPSMYRNEYMKKLYQLSSATPQPPTPTAPTAKKRMAA